MQDDWPEFTDQQWAFLSVLDAFQAPVTIELAGNLAPLMPGPLIDLLENAEKRNWIKKIDRGTLSIAEELPAEARRRLSAINRPEHLSMLIDRIRTENLEKILAPGARTRLMYRAGRVREAAEAEIEMARQFLAESNYEKAGSHLMNAVSRLEECTGVEAQKLFIAGVLQLSNISFIIGKGFIEIDRLLHKAHASSATLGDQRSHAVINLHLGRLYYFTNRREDALVALSLGAQEVEELDDGDIRSQAAPFLGIYSFIKGNFRDAFAHFEEAEKVFISGAGSVLESSMTPIFFGYCAVYLGRFHQAMGSLDLAYRLALDRSNKELAATIRAVLGTVLVLLKKPQAASIHLNRAFEDANQTQNAYALYLCGGGLALRYFLDGALGKAYEVLGQTTLGGHRAGLVRQFASPWILEMLFEFDRRGYAPLPGFEYAAIMETIFEGVNVHLQGVALRLRAKAKLLNGEKQESAGKDLDQSAELLRLAGDPIQLSKTLLEIAHLKLTRGESNAARKIAQEARHCLGGYIDEFFPKEYKHLIEDQAGQGEEHAPKEEFLEKYLEMIESLYSCESREEILTTVLSKTSRMFGAERSALFYFPQGRPHAAPETTAVLNLSPKEVATENFKASRQAIRKVFETGTPLADKLILHESLLGKRLTRSILCIPVDVRDRVQNVLYYDNSYLEDAFQRLDLATIGLMARHTNFIIERRFEHLKILKKAQALSSEKSSRLESSEKAIFTRSAKMKKLLEQTDKIAATDSTVLIQGETGTGKELLAYRIYNQSRRSEGPFVIVDATTIPESLLESELFGYEKGAFTGADKRKIGCLEIAHQGTLFLDEIGELTLPAQTKLLRALQEKTIRRVGGVQPVKTDFRLIAATNRDLAREIAKGRFREDLYYRLNVIALTLPPLRERGEDAVYLAQHFVDVYSKKHNQEGLELSPTQKSALKDYAWPGNIRELKNKIERAVVLSGENGLVFDLPSGEPLPVNDPFADKPTLNEIQRRYIRHILGHTGGRVSGRGGATEILGLKRTSLYTRMKALGMKKSPQ